MLAFSFVTFVDVVLEEEKSVETLDQNVSPAPPTPAESEEPAAEAETKS